MLQREDIDAIIIGDGKGDNFIHPDVNYFNPSDKSIYTYRSNDYDGVFYIADTHRLYNNFVEDIYAILNFEVPIIAIFDWEMFNGVKRGNFPVSTATSTRPDNFRGICKVWIKDTLLHASKTSEIPIAVIVTPSVLSPFHLTEEVRKGAEYYLAQKLWEIIENFKIGESPEVNKGDLKVIYDIIHNTDVAHAAINIFKEELVGYYMLSSNRFLRFTDVLEIFYGRLVQSLPIKLENTGIIIKNRRRTLENYDTTIDMVSLWSDVIYHTLLSLDVIFDDIIHVMLTTNKDYEIIEKAIMHLLV
jgi:hypothetical protein